MEENSQSEFFYMPPVAKLRLILMMFAILYTYGSFSFLGKINGAVLGFTFPALFIISGYLVLHKSEDTEKQILRAIGRTLICFVIMFAVYLGLSFLLEREATVAAITSKAFWIDFLLLNICSLPIGSTIWYVQSLLYAYIIIYLIYKLKLLKFDIYIALILLALSHIAGDLSSFFGFNFLGHSYLGANFFTRALPYILIGCFINRKEEIFDKLKSYHFIFMIVGGAVIAAAEGYYLYYTKSGSYYAHLFGMELVAVGISFFAFLMYGMMIRTDMFRMLTRFELMIPFYVCSPIYYLCNMLIESVTVLDKYLGIMPGIITTVLSFAVLYLYAFIRMIIAKRMDLANADGEYKIVMDTRQY